MNKKWKKKKWKKNEINNEKKWNEKKNEMKIWYKMYTKLILQM